MFYWFLWWFYRVFNRGLLCFTGFYGGFIGFIRVLLVFMAFWLWVKKMENPWGPQVA